MKTTAPIESRLRALAAAALLATTWAAGSARAVTLYDPSLGSVPSAQGWVTTGIGPYTQGTSGGLYQFGTLATDLTRAGSAMTGLSLLDTAAGFTLDLDLRVIAESHSRDERAGFSLIVTGSDPSRAIEIAFWTDHVWAYTADFAHGVDAAFDSTVATDYTLTVQNQQYTLAAGGVTLFGGSLVDYRAQGAPYTVPGFLFFGDDTSSARASVEVGAVSVAAIGAVPEPATVLLLAGGLIALALRRRAS